MQTIYARSVSGLQTLGTRLAERLGLDRAAVMAITGKIWTLGAGLVTTLFIAVYFSSTLQGYYYTFNAVLAFQAVAELGLGTVLVAYASHEWAKLTIDASGRAAGNPDALSRLASLARFALLWYLVAGAAATAALVFWGIAFFDAPEDPAFAWKGPWITLCAITGLNFLMVPVVALLEGCNQVSRVYTYRLIQYVASSAAGWAAIYLGAGLWTASIIGATGLLAMAVLAGRRYGRFMSSIVSTQPQGPRLNWRADILPMQWRIAVSWIGGYFTFSLFTPVLFHYHGSVVAGQMGMTWALVGALTAIATAWVLPKTPAFGILIAQEKYAELDLMFRRMTGSVLTVIVACAACIWGLVFALHAVHHPFANRLLPPGTTAYLLLGTVIVCASMPMSAYLRAHKKEPLMGLSLASGCLTGIGVVILGKHYSADGVAIAYLAVMASVAPVTVLVWRRRRSEWHSATIAHR